MPLPQVITPGDDIAIVQDLYEDGELADLSGATITAALQDGDGRVLLPRTAQSSSASGAAWAEGRVVCEFTAASSLSLSQGTVYLEINVTRSAKRTTWPLIEIEVQAGIPT